jgi:hypothetical protein
MDFVIRLFRGKRDGPNTHVSAGVHCINSVPPTNSSGESNADAEYNPTSNRQLPQRPCDCTFGTLAEPNENSYVQTLRTRFLTRLGVNVQRCYHKHARLCNAK